MVLVSHLVLFYKVELSAVCEISAQQMVINHYFPFVQFLGKKKNSEVVMQRKPAACTVTQPVPEEALEMTHRILRFCKKVKI